MWDGICLLFNYIESVLGCDSHPVAWRMQSANWQGLQLLLFYWHAAYGKRLVYTRCCTVFELHIVSFSLTHTNTRTHTHTHTHTHAHTHTHTHTHTLGEERDKHLSFSYEVIKTEQSCKMSRLTSCSRAATRPPETGNEGGLTEEAIPNDWRWWRCFWLEMMRWSDCVTSPWVIGSNDI